MPSICLQYGLGVALGGLSAGASRKSENSVIMRIAGTVGARTVSGGWDLQVQLFDHLPALAFRKSEKT